MRVVTADGSSVPLKSPYSPALLANGWVFLSGQGGFDPKTGELVSSDIVAQTEQTLQNVSALLERAGSSLADVTSVTVHLADLKLYPQFNEVYTRWFGPPRPTRTTVGAALLLGMLVEITVLARPRGNSQEPPRFEAAGAEKRISS